MRVQQRHPVMCGDELDLFEPQVGRRLAQDLRQRVVLDEGVRQLDEPSKDERPEAHCAAGNRFKGVRIEEGKIVLNVERLHPFRITVCERGSEAGRACAGQLSVDARRA